MPFSPEQSAAIQRSGQDVCCVAGPGSGKTTVLVERFAWLVEQGYEPESILAITFTEKAATQIKERLVRRFRGQEDKRKGVERATVCTIHAFCMRLLSENAVRAQLDPRFALMDEREARTLQASAMEAVLDRLATERREEFLTLAESWSTSEMAGPLLSIYEDLRMAGGAREGLSRLAGFDAAGSLGAFEAEVQEALDASPAASTDAQKRRLAVLREWLAARESANPVEWLQAFKYDRRGLKAGHPLYDAKDRLDLQCKETMSVVVGALHLAQRALVREVLIEFEDEYRRRKREVSRLDFGDLEERAYELLRSDSAVRAEVQERIGMILMDELQDTNPVQWRILDLVRRPGRFFAVGDINQSIFGFRHAEPGQFAAYQESIAATGTVDRLERNYRSRAEILESVMDATVRLQAPGVRPHELIAERKFPPQSEPVVEVQRVEAAEGIEEALWIARRLRELHGTLMVGDPPRPARYSDMAVLARSKAPFEPLEEAFARFGIPCVIDRGRNFFAEPEIVDLTNALRVLDNPADPIALFGLLRSPLIGVPDAEILACEIAGGLAPEWAMRRILAYRANREETPSERILARWMDDTGYLQWLTPRGRANASKFLRLLRSAEASGAGSLAEQIAQIDDLRAAAQEPNAPELEAGDAVQILTVHQSKGLEFKVIVVAAMHRQARGFPGPVVYSRRSGLGLRWRLPDAHEGSPDAVYRAAQAETAEREAHEEDRLLYVAMSRAEERLILSWTQKDRMGAGNWATQMERGLAFEWPDAFDDARECGRVRVVRRTGEPELLEPVAGSRPAAAEQLVDRLETTARASAAVTATAVATWLDCPRRYFLQTYVGWPRPELAGGIGAAALGTEVHELLGGLLEEEEASEEARELAAVFEESELARRALKARRVERESDFLAEIEGTLVRGQIDLWFEEQDGARVVVDYKTDRHLDERRLRSYELQLGLYAAVLGPKVREAWLFGLREGHPHRVDLSRRDDARRALLELADAEARGDFPCAEAPRCRWCPYVNAACPVRIPD